MKRYVVSVASANDFEQFVAAFNRGFCEIFGGKWNGRSWDAFNDYLSWPPEDEYALVFEGWGECRGLSEQDRAMITEIINDNRQVTVVFA